MKLAIFQMKRFPKLAAALLATGLVVSGCNTADRDNAVLGGAAGAVIGGATTGTLEGAAVGGAIGAGTGVLLGRVVGNPRMCWYRNRYGGRYMARCR